MATLQLNYPSILTLPEVVGEAVPTEGGKVYSLDLYTSMASQIARGVAATPVPNVEQVATTWRVISTTHRGAQFPETEQRHLAIELLRLQNAPIPEGVDTNRLVRLCTYLIAPLSSLTLDGTFDNVNYAAAVEKIVSKLISRCVAINELILSGDTLGITSIFSDSDNIYTEKLHQEVWHFITMEHSNLATDNAFFPIDQAPFPFLNGKQEKLKPVYEATQARLSEELANSITIHTYGGTSHTTKSMPAPLEKAVADHRAVFFGMGKGWNVGSSDWDNTDCDPNTEHHVMRACGYTPFNGYARTHSHMMPTVTAESNVDDITQALRTINALPFNDDGLNSDAYDKLSPSTSMQIAEKLQHLIVSPHPQDLNDIEKQLIAVATLQQPIMILERLMPPVVPTSRETRLDPFPFLTTIMLHIAAREFVKGETELWLIQTDDAFAKQLKRMFGDPELEDSGLLHLATISQQKTDTQTGEIIPDNCHTFALHLGTIFTILFERNPPFAQAVLNQVAALSSVEFANALKARYMVSES